MDGHKGVSYLGVQQASTGMMCLALGFQEMKNTLLIMAQLL